MILAVLGVFPGAIGCHNVSAAGGINWMNVFRVEPGNNPGDNNLFFYKAGWVANLIKELNGSEELVFPEKYEIPEVELREILDGEDEETIKGFMGEWPVEFRSYPLNNSATTYKDNLPGVKSITFNEQTKQVDAGMLFRFSGAETVTFNAKELTLMKNIAFYDGVSSDADANSYASAIKTIYIKADTIKSVDAETFSHINDKVVVYVTDEQKRTQILEATKGGTSPLKEEQVKIEDTRLESEITVSCEKINYGTKGGFDPKVELIKHDETTDPQITYGLYKNEQCRDSYVDDNGETQTDKAGYFYNQDNIPVGIYYLKATLGSTDNYKASYAVIRVEVLENKVVDKEKLNKAIAAAEAFYEENQYKQANFDKSKWDKVFYQGETLDEAKRIAGDKDNMYPQEQVNAAADALTAALDALKTSKADNTAAWNELQEWIAKAEAYLAKQDEYTEESWNRINPPRNINDAKALKKEEATVEQINSAINSLKRIEEGLVLKEKGSDVKPGDPFAFIPKGGTEVKALSMTAPESLAGAAKIRVTFKCADDVSFNQYASIDLKAVVAGTENYQQIKGTEGYETGTSHTVELPLSAAIKAGDSIELFMATYSWEGAKDWVYGITAVEFVGADDKVLGSYIDKDVFKENLASAIKEAEAINTSTYTDESVKKLTEALEAAKALKEDATAAEMSKAIDAINEAIKGLKKKDDDTEEAKKKVTAAIKEAEAIDSSLYTPESYEKLKKALEAAKALKDDATPEEIEKAAQAINDAIKGLVKKDGSKNPQDETKVIGTAKGKTFTAGNFKYKVSVAATITGTVKTAGKVTVTGLSKTGKKKSSISVKNTVSASGASYQVTGIGSKAFQKAVKLKKATLGTNVKSIPTSAFSGCKKLTTVKATGVTKIGGKAFKDCKMLKKLTFGKKKLSSVKKGAFKGCKKTIKVTGGSKKVKKGNLKKLKKSGYKKFK